VFLFSVDVYIRCRLWLVALGGAGLFVSVLRDRWVLEVWDLQDALASPR
jgi:hypothetical protein